jgi:hypothetical protein
MERFPSAATIFLVQLTIAWWLNGEIFTPNWRECTTLLVVGVLLILFSHFSDIAFFIKLGQQHPVTNFCREFSKQLHINKEATAMRQSAEWGIRAIQSSFPHDLKDRFTYEEN